MNKKYGELIKGETVDYLTSSDLYEGNAWLEIKSLEDYKQIDQFIQCLRLLDNIRIKSFNWSENEGVTVVVSLQNPLPLGDILCQMPMIEHVYRKREKNHIAI